MPNDYASVLQQQQQQQHSRSLDSDDVKRHTDVGLLESASLVFRTHPLPAELLYLYTDVHANLW